MSRPSGTLGYTPSKVSASEGLWRPRRRREIRRGSTRRRFTVHEYHRMAQAGTGRDTARGRPGGADRGEDSRDEPDRESLPTPEDVLLLIEVSDKTLAYDRGIKLPLYARKGLREAWTSRR